MNVLMQFECVYLFKFIQEEFCYLAKLLSCTEREKQLVVQEGREGGGKIKTNVYFVHEMLIVQLLNQRRH